MKKLDKTKGWFEKYDRKTSEKMAAHNRSGGDVARPVRDVSKASEGEKWTRAKFIYRKAAQALSAGHPLKDDQGRPTPAALQFKRWSAKVPKDREDLQELKSLGVRLKSRYKPK